MPVQTLRIPESVVFEVLEGQTVLLELGSGTYWRLNATGTALWKQIEEHGDLARAAEHIAFTFSAPIERVREDADGIVRRLIDARLLTMEPAGAGA